jgi:hypothetical protein
MMGEVRKVFPEPCSIVSIWKSRKSAALLPTKKGAAHGDAVVETALAHVLRTADAPLGELHRGEFLARYALRCGLC